MEDDVVARSTSLLDGLRGFGANYTEFTRRFANWLGLHPTDAAALVEILYAEDTGSPLSPALLGERIALTSGATTNLLNRLESLGYVVRTRESTDRRKVTLRSGADIQGPAREFFGPFSAGLAALVAEYPAEEIERFENFLRHLRSTMDKVLEEQG
ncbi:MarR family winged helix-turn-helix transcriptional regulator [Amycolatopsis azurea]|uniref:MarR family transcriptional regulator n=1 Tax=Amycolatopsis azurea DSM 43854 TaxID=1238180 RepID=M2NY76_9PSEU|nr:helix-turn-helix domain-containing protein [Amycolatopsis azurea]EMD27614.1 Transcriptional regulator, MarR family [Amycolatopsis azurea DSM 43854]OOC03022.1 MarR family transcriptional regulator [Amycolatopsis azurea DSM 43854]